MSSLFRLVSILCVITAVARPLLQHLLPAQPGRCPADLGLCG